MPPKLRKFVVGFASLAARAGARVSPSWRETRREARSTTGPVENDSAGDEAGVWRNRRDTRDEQSRQISGWRLRDGLMLLSRKTPTHEHLAALARKPTTSVHDKIPCTRPY
jgi:hypothetical protein